MSCSISVPEKPSLARANFARSNPAASRPRFFKCRANNAARTSLFGKSTKKISSNRPLRSISGGSTVMLFEVAARNTPPLAVLHPGQECGKQPLRQTGVGVAARAGRGKRLFNFVDPQHQRSEFLRQFQRFVQPPLALADVFVVEGARVQPPQFESPLARDRAGGQALPATLHPSDKHALWRHQPEPPPFGSQGILSLRNPVTEVPQPRHVHK